MNWAILVVAGIFEVGWAIGLKYTEGFIQVTRRGTLSSFRFMFRSP
jgi:multidrug transporter EmrE-like cation transporter